MDQSITDAIRAGAAGCHGVVLASCLRRHGVTRPAVARRVAAGLVQRTEHGQLVVPGLTDVWTPAVLATARSELLAVTHGYAACSHGWDGCEPLLDRPPTWVVPWTSRPDLRAWRRRDLPRSELMMVGAVRVTSPLWTLRTLGEVADVTTVELAVESALRLRQVADDDLWRLAGEGSGTRALEWVLRARGRGSRPTGSWLETRALQLVLRPAGIEVVARQVDIYEGDFWHARPDFLLPGWTILEVDGRQHADVAQKRHDNDRDLRLCGLGLRVVRLDAVQILEARTHAGRRLQRVIDEGRRAHADAPPPLAGGCLRF